MMPSPRGPALVCAALVLACGLAAAALLPPVGSGGAGAREGEAATEDFFSGTTRYAVPVRYHAGISRYSEKRGCSAVTMMLFLPDLSPAADHAEELKTPGWRNRMTLLFEHGPHSTDTDGQIASMTTMAKGVHTQPGAVQRLLFGVTGTGLHWARPEVELMSARRVSVAAHV